MIQKQIAGWLIEIDKDSTKAVYLERPLYIGCKCNICRNFSAAIPDIPDAVRLFFSEMGIDPAKPSEIYENGFKNGHVQYGGFYHIVGNYISGDDIWQPVADEHEQQKETECFKIADGFEIGFTRQLALIPKDFPRPVLQMEIHFSLPWVLDEPYE